MGTNAPGGNAPGAFCVATGGVAARFSVWKSLLMLRNRMLFCGGRMYSQGKNKPNPNQMEEIMNTNTTAKARRNSGIAAAAISFAMAMMLACAPIASAAEANAMADPIGNNTQVMASAEGSALDSQKPAMQDLSVQKSSKVSFKKLSANKAISDYLYVGKYKMKYYTKISKPKVRISGNKKVITYTQTLAYVKPSQKVAKVFLKAKSIKGDTYTIPFDKNSQYCLDSFSDCKVTYGKAKASNYKTLVKGYGKVPMKFTQTVTVTVPKNYKGTSIGLFTFNKNNNIHYRYALNVG